MKERILDVIRKSVSITTEIYDNTPLLEVNIDSIVFITIIVGLEEEFGIHFDDIQLVYDNYETIGKLISSVQKMVSQ